MRYRLCAASDWVCHCDDVAAQPCIARLVSEYLDTIRYSVLTDGAEGGPGDAVSVRQAERDLWVTMRAFPTVAECERWSISQGCGGFIQLKR